MNQKAEKLGNPVISTGHCKGSGTKSFTVPQIPNAICSNVMLTGEAVSWKWLPTSDPLA
jgi:hypothetical protein